MTTLRLLRSLPLHGTSLTSAVVMVSRNEKGKVFILTGTVYLHLWRDPPCVGFFDRMRIGVFLSYA